MGDSYRAYPPSESISPNLYGIKAVNGFIGRTDHVFVDKDRDGRWPIPVGIKYETFIKIPQELYKHGADSKPIRPAKLADLMSINKQTIGGNLAFLASVGIVKRAKPRSYKTFVARDKVCRGTRHRRRQGHKKSDAEP